MKKSEELIIAAYADNSGDRKINPETIMVIVQVIMTIMQSCKNKRTMLNTCRNRPVMAQIHIARALREKDISRKNAQEIVSTVFDLGRTSEVEDINQFIEDYKTL